MLAPRARVMVECSPELELEAGKWRKKAGEDTEPKDGALERVGPVSGQWGEGVM